MKYTITINQSAIFSNGMINKTDLVDWAIIDYLKDFAIYKKSKRIYVDNEPSPSPSTNQSSKSARSKYLQTISRDNITQEGRGDEYIWLNYNHLINSLPLAHFRVKSAISYRINKLRGLGLIKTIRNNDNTLYYTFTDKLIDICFCKSSDIARLRAKNIDPVKPNATDPVQIGITGGVKTAITAQYKTKISIYNKYNNNKKNFVNLLSLKPKTDKQEINPAPIYTKPEIIDTSNNLNITRYRNRCGVNADNNRNNSFFSSSLRKQKTNTKPHGFTTMSGSVWKILADIKERQKISSMKNKQITRSNL